MGTMEYGGYSGDKSLAKWLRVGSGFECVFIRPNILDNWFQQLWFDDHFDFRDINPEHHAGGRNQQQHQCR